MKILFRMLVFLGLSFALSCQNSSSESKTEEPLPLDAEQAYQSISKSLNESFPGRGIDVFDEQVKDRPMAYSLILRAEVNRLTHSDDTNDQLLDNAFEWLMNNHDINENGFSGYGIPDKWDAFQDGTINPTNQEYTITTAMVIASLLDYYEYTNDTAQRKEVKQLIKICLQPFSSVQLINAKGLLPYSMNPNDTVYGVINPTAYMAGQMARFARITSDSTFKDSLRLTSDSLMNSIEGYMLKDVNGNNYWNYSLENPSPNDLVHLSYIIEGIKTYQHYSAGKNNIDLKSCLDHTVLFQKGGVWYEYASEELQKPEINARLWSLGMLLYTYSSNNSKAGIDDAFLKQLNKYQKSNGQFQFKENDDRVMIRQSAHLLFGLSYYLYN